MAKNIQLLLTENVDNLGIVGDVVTVRSGYARNFLLPRQLATKPSDDAIKALAAKRAEAEKQIAVERSKRAEIVKKLEGVEISLVRPCNDLGILYGAVTQHEVSKLLHEKGFEVRPRDVRLSQAIKRVDNYDIHIKFEADLEATVKLHVLPDRKLEVEEQKPDLDFDMEGNLVEPGQRGRGDRGGREDREDRRAKANKFMDNLTQEVKKGWGSAKPAEGAAPAAAAAAPAEGAKEGGKEKKAGGKKAKKE